MLTKSQDSRNTHTLVEIRNGTATLESSSAESCQVSRKPSNSTPRYLPEKMKTHVHTNDLSTDVHSSIVRHSVGERNTTHPHAHTHWEQPNVHQEVNAASNPWHSHARMLRGSEKDSSIDACSLMDESQKSVLSERSGSKRKASLWRGH